MSPTLLFGTNNAHKLAEITDLLAGKMVLVSLAQAGIHFEVEETEPSLEGNARLKAETYGKAAGIPCFADDTGLEVEALNGAPGVFSARYAGQGGTPNDNVKKLLRELAEHTNRKARFRTVIAFFDGKNTHFFAGEARGHIAYSPSGEQGFGYDPVFVPEGSNKTFAEMTAEEKNGISHRARALKAFLAYLQA